MNSTARGFLADALVATFAFAGGVAFGLLLAPRSGRETRQQIVQQRQNTQRWMEQQMQQTQQQFAENTQQAVERIREATQQTLETYLPIDEQKWDREVGEGLRDDLDRQFKG